MTTPVVAEKIFSIGQFPVTNSIINGWLAAGGFLALALLLNRNKFSMAPKGLQNALEALIEFMLGFMDQVTHDRERSKRFLPIVGTLFLFILVSNWMGLIPGVGSIGIWEMVHGERELVPLFRAATSDLNLTLAIGVGAVVVSHVFGIMTIGFFRYWGKFIQVAGIWRALRRFGHVNFADALIGLFTALTELAVGFIELLSEAAKMVSLSLRLFGNVFAGEVLLTVIASLIAFLAPLPFMGMEIIVGIVQALVFAMLTLVYLTMATEPPHGEEEQAHASH